MRTVWPHCFHNEDVSKDLVEVAFEDTTITVPRSKGFLENCYSKNYMEPKISEAHYFVVDGKLPFLHRIYGGIAACAFMVGLVLVLIGIFAIPKRTHVKSS